MARFNRGLLRDRTGNYSGAIEDYSAVLKEYPNFLAGYQYRAQARRKVGDLKGADADEFKVLKAQIESQNGTKKQTASADKTRKKSDKNVENYRKIVGTGQECNYFATADVCVELLRASGRSEAADQLL